MKRRLFLTLLAIAILLLAVGGWSVAALRAAIKMTLPVRDGPDRRPIRRAVALSRRRV